MASSTSLASNANMGSASPSTPAGAQSTAANRGAVKFGSRGAEAGRRQSPVDNTRRGPPQKAWTSGTNPLTQKNIQHSQNGNMSQSKSNLPRPAAQKEISFTDRSANDRFRYILTAAIGTMASVTTKNGDQYEGVVSSLSSQSSNTMLSVKMCRKTSQSSTGNIRNSVVHQEPQSVGKTSDETMEFDIRNIADIIVTDLRLPEVGKVSNGVGADFQTDTDISAHRTMQKPRELQPWVPEGDLGNDESLESAGNTAWDQFEANERLFGMTSTYDENHYTTQIDRSASSYKLRGERAKKIAQEIEGKVGDTAHLREERGQALEEDGEDEEAKYSGVKREATRSYLPLSTGAPNSYMPPARRPPTSVATVAGAPVDPAIISSQLSRPDGVKVALPKNTARIVDTIAEEDPLALQGEEKSLQSVSSTLTDSASSKTQEPNSTLSTTTMPSQKSPVPENDTEGVEVKVLEEFRNFANSEKLKLSERKRTQAHLDRTARLNDFKRFSANLNLRSAVPVDLVGILAKDPAKQEQIIEKARSDMAVGRPEIKNSTTSEAPKVTRDIAELPITKFDPATIPPPILDRQTFLALKNRERLPSQPVGVDRSATNSTVVAARGNAYSQRPALDRRQVAPPNVPASIPLPDARMAPLTAAADMSNASSPQRSAVHTPTSSISAKFNVKALEFRPNANAAVFNPALSNAPSSPASAPRGPSPPRTISPATFFAGRKSRTDDRPSILSQFNPLERMKKDEEKRKREKQAASNTDVQKDFKDFTSNGGIPNAFMTGPRWTVKTENLEKTYTQLFEKPAAPVRSPYQSRSNSSHHVPYHQQVPGHLQNGQHAIPQISTPQFANSQHIPNPHYPVYDESQRMSVPMSAATSQFASPRLQTTQMGLGAYTPNMGHPVQLAYGAAPQYYGAQVGQSPLPNRQFSGQQYMHSPAAQAATPAMMTPGLSGNYMANPAHFQAMPMQSPGLAYPFPQQNGYPSPGRNAPMMSHQGSQQGHQGGQQMAYTLSQQGHMTPYGAQPVQMAGMRSGYNSQGPYGSSPMQQHPYPQRAMSSGYGGKMMQQMPSSHGPPRNAPQHPSSYADGEV